MTQSSPAIVEALQLAYHELKLHDADYHHRTSVEVNNKIVDALGEAAGDRLVSEQFERDAGAYLKAKHSTAALRSPDAAARAQERCPSCFGTDADYKLGAYRCSNPWHADDHLRAKTLARQTTTSVLPHPEGQGVECDGGLRTFETSGTTLRRTCKVFTITCESDEIANRVADQLRSPDVAQAVPDRAAIIEECARVLDECAQDWRRIRDPGMANNAAAYAKKIRALAISSTDRGGA